MCFSSIVWFLQFLSSLYSALNFEEKEQTSTAKLPLLFQRFQTKGLALRVKETKITTENAFN